jgi:hypothetical protein
VPVQCHLHAPCPLFRPDYFKSDFTVPNYFLIAFGTPKLGCGSGVRGEVFAQPRRATAA